ncbi:MAG TPA: helix-turn-helix transcriptional regulator, partial [Micromonosporaceae bacterium]|nr:helix-turn-helix transcriptional regulator [Micromonosporaceae bacterium]
VTGTAEALADAGLPWEAAALCGAAAARLSDPAAAKDLLGAGRALRARFVTRGAAAGGLSGRERAVGELLLDGLTQKEIGARLYISPKTVEQHVARLRQKLGAGNRAELIAALRVRLSGISVR